MKGLLNKLKPKWQGVSTGVFVLFIGFLGSVGYSHLLAIIEPDGIWKNFKLLWTYNHEAWLFLLIVLIGLLVYLQRKIRLTNDPFDYDDETFQVDRAFFNLLISKYITQEMMMAPRNNEFASSSFQSNKLHAFIDIRSENDRSDFEFFNPELEGLKQGVFKDVEELLTVTSTIICDTSSPDWWGIPREWSLEKKEEASAKIEKVENQLCTKYDEFVRRGRKILKTQ